MTCVLRRGREIWTQTQKEDVKTEAEFGVMLPQTKECLGLSEAGRNRKESSPREFVDSMALTTPGLQTSRLQEQ